MTAVEARSQGDTRSQAEARSQVAALIRKDLRAVRRSKAIVWPMVIVPSFLLVALPAGMAWFARSQPSPDLSTLLDRLPGNLGRGIAGLPAREQMLVLVNGHLLLPLFIVVPLMVSAVLAADAFAGEKERRTLETLLHLPIDESRLYVAKLLVAFVPSIALSWIGFVAFALVSNVIAWPVMHRIFVPTGGWLVVIGWVTPAVGALGLGIMVRVSSRSETTQEANQLGGAVIMPLIIASVGQATGLLLIDASAVWAIGAVIWLAAAWLIRGGMRRFTRDSVASRL